MQVSLKTEGLTIQWADNAVSNFPYLWLRDTDPAGFHPQTGERTFDLTSVPLDIKALSAEIDDDSLVIHWPDTSSPSRFLLSWIRLYQPGQRRKDLAEEQSRLWRGEFNADKIARFAAGDLLQSNDVLEQWLRATKRDGLSIVDGLGDTIEAG